MKIVSLPTVIRISTKKSNSLLLVGRSTARKIS